MNIIDIRSYDEYISGHINNAKWIEKNVLLNNPATYLNKNEIYYIYCNSGFNSSMVVSNLNNLGYNTLNIDGGYRRYKNLKRRGL